jgi:hypothetical protein
MERGGSRHDRLLRLSILPVRYPDFINIEREIGWTTLDRIMHAAYNLIKKHSWNLQTRRFLWRAFLLDQFRRMRSNEGIHPSVRHFDLADFPAIVLDFRACDRDTFLRLAGDRSQDISVRFRADRRMPNAECRPRDLGSLSPFANAK